MQLSVRTPIIAHLASQTSFPIRLSTPAFQSQISDSQIPSISSPSKVKARYIMIGGFLGAGKTTAVAKLAQRLSQRGLKVGLITNDQGSELVDTKMLRAHGFATEEIPGGCFCCRFNSLVDAADKLTASTQPDVFVAEPVGSCTDLVATVTYPLRRIYGDSFLIAPVSVLLDPVRARRECWASRRAAISPEKVVYIYKKQLSEEADIIVINKTDTCSLLHASRGITRRAGPRSSTLRGDRGGFDTGRDEISMPGFRGSKAASSPTSGRWKSITMCMPTGEALLRGVVQRHRPSLAAAAPFDAEKVITLLARSIQEHLKAQRAEVAHLKMTYSPDEALAGEIAAVNLVRNDFVPELSLKLQDPSSGGQLIINLRAENAPEALAAIVRESLGHLERDVPGLTAGLEHLEHFRPGRPTPTHRDVAKPPRRSMTAGSEGVSFQRRRGRQSGDSAAPLNYGVRVLPCGTAEFLPPSIRWRLRVASHGSEARVADDSASAAPAACHPRSRMRDTHSTQAPSDAPHDIRSLPLEQWFQ